MAKSAGNTPALVDRWKNSKNRIDCLCSGGYNRKTVSGSSAGKRHFTLAEQVQKRQLDMLHGSVWDKIPRFALPVAATAILEQLFNASDVAVVGNFTGEARTAAVAAVGANSAIIGLIVNLFIGIALGANVVIAHAIG